MLRELNERSSNGITVWLLWNDDAKNDPTKPEFQVKVMDVSDGDLFTIHADTFAQAREAYYHPFAMRNYALKTGRLKAIEDGRIRPRRAT